MIQSIWIDSRFLVREAEIERKNHIRTAAARKIITVLISQK